jgi:hypothetical protein
MSVTFGTEADAPALAGRVGIARRFSQGGCPGLICPHAAGVQNIRTSVPSSPPAESGELGESPRDPEAKSLPGGGSRDPARRRQNVGDHSRHAPSAQRHAQASMAGARPHQWLLFLTRPQAELALLGRVDGALRFWYLDSVNRSLSRRTVKAPSRQVAELLAMPPNRDTALTPLNTLITGD